MEWKESPIQDRRLCKGRVDAGETAASPENEQIQALWHELLSSKFDIKLLRCKMRMCVKLTQESWKFLPV